jgi:hypothetical protein
MAQQVVVCVVQHGAWAALGVKKAESRSGAVENSVFSNL